MTELPIADHLVRLLWCGVLAVVWWWLLWCGLVRCNGVCWGVVWCDGGCCGLMWYDVMWCRKIWHDVKRDVMRFCMICTCKMTG